jgi:hypothetical protein
VSLPEWADATNDATATTYDPSFTNPSSVLETPCHQLALAFEIQGLALTDAAGYATLPLVDPCFTTDALGLPAFAYMCPNACAAKTPYVAESTAAATPSDEADAAGSSSRRRLTAGDFFDISWGQSVVKHYRNYLISDFLAPGDATACAAVEADDSSWYTKLTHLAGTTSWWSWSFSPTSDVSSDSKCWDETHCGEHTTCTMNQMRYAQEKAYIDGSYEVALRSQDEA